MLFRSLKLTIALLVSMCLPAMASAAMISASYQVNLNDSDPGLVVGSADYADNPFSFDLNAGESTTFNLFKIWTTEGTVNSDDKVAKPISVDFNFTAPELMSGSVNGNTSGDSVLFGLTRRLCCPGTVRLTWCLAHWAMVCFVYPSSTPLLTKASLGWAATAPRLRRGSKIGRAHV